MSWILDRLHVSGFQGYREIEFNLRPEPNFFVGINGSGKTTLIELLTAALRLDEHQLLKSAFTRITIDFKDLESRRKPSLVLTRSQSEKRRSNLIRGELRTAQSEPPIRFFFVDENFFYSNRLHSFGSHDEEFDEIENYTRLSDVKTIIGENLLTCWLSVHRGITHEVFDEDGDLIIANPIDQKLSDLAVHVSHFFSSLDNQAARLTSEYQKSFFLSLLDARPGTLRSIESSVIDDERKALIQIFLEFGLTQSDFGKTLDDHFVRVKRTNDWLISRDKNPELADRSAKGIDIFSIFDTQRIHKLVERWRELEKRKSEIFEPKNQLKQIVDTLFYEKYMAVDDRNQVAFVNEISGSSIPSSNLSSGEKQIFILLVEAMLQEKAPTVYLADEPELSLHIDWQERLVESILALNPNAQIVFATHSPDIISAYDMGLLHMETR